MTEQQAFDTIDAAIDWMYEEVNDPYINNVAVAFLDDPASIKAFDDRQLCCGIFEEDVVIAGRKARIGCDYGH